mmetsp:Transcript_147948/g.283515  ORF Transcript_147948/g.283515 Transcript_147948/m.283515 type:complete len:203 (-) Transcript_147948:587-1195(-)
MLFCFRYLRNSQNCFISSLDMFRRAVIDALTLPMMEESATSAQNRMAIEKIRSGMLVAKISIDAGVNWVIDQCKEVKYCHSNPSSKTGVSPISCNQFFGAPASLDTLPTKNQAHATMWFKIRIKISSLPNSKTMNMYSLSIKLYTIFTTFFSFMMRRRRRIRITRRARRIRPSPATRTVLPMSFIIQSGTTTAKSIQSHPFK